MKRTAFILAAMAGLSLMCTGLAADTKTFVAAGKVTQSTAEMVKVYTPVQTLEIARDKNTKVVGDVKKGAKVKVTYTKVNGMPHALEITVTGK
jgi:Cu/Ag efflux protein CusF